MADHTVYVNGTDNSASWMFTSLSSALSYMQTNYPNLDTNNGSGGSGILNIEISITTEESSAVTVAAAFSTTAAYYINIYTTAAARHSGVWSDSKYRIVAGDVNRSLQVSARYVRIAGLQVKLSSSSANEQQAFGILSQDGASIIHVDSCIFQTPHAGTNSLYGVYLGNANVTLYMWNCIVDEGGEGASSYSSAFTAQAAATVYLYNCTLIGTYAGITDYGSASVTIKNTYCYGSNAGGPGVDTSSYSASNTTELGGTGDVDSVDLNTTNFVSVTRGNADYLKPKSGGALVDAGNAPGGSAPLNYTTDIAGDTVSTWDIGAFNYSDAGVGQFARPASTEAAGNWTYTGAASLHAALSETTASDSEYATSAASPSNDTMTLGLSSIAAPTSGTCTLRVRARYV
jgi:hypothetical protein